MKNGQIEEGSTIKRKRVRLFVQYDGTNYHGWQAQNNGVTIEGELGRALMELTGEEIQIIGCSRTDAGVHALCNVAVFDTESRIPPEKFRYAINARLPEDVRISRSDEVPSDWHPRKRKSSKTYEYRIYTGEILPPTKRLYIHHVYRKLDLEAMREAARYLVGEHDFKSFCQENAQVETTVRTIYDIELEFIPEKALEDASLGVKSVERIGNTEKAHAGVKGVEEAERESAGVKSLEEAERESAGVKSLDGAERESAGVKSLDGAERESAGVKSVDGAERESAGVKGVDGADEAESAGRAGDLRIRVTGGGFLYNMVRIIVGTLLEVGYGRIKPQEMQEILDKKDRSAAGPTAPAKGLTLMNITFSEESEA